MVGMALALGSCAAENVGNLEITGIVYDKSTQKPIEGAYVLATYKGSRGTIGGHSSSYCYMTQGMYTAADGKFHFPVTAVDYGSPAFVNAIKAGFYFSDNVYHKFDIHKDPKAWFSNRDIFLLPQDPSKPSFKFLSGEDYCDGAETEGDAAAVVTFMKIELSEYSRYGASQQRIGAVTRMINRMATLPDTPPTRTSK
jgi:hypothetical protein